VIGVDVLSDQRDLAHPGVDEALRFGDDFRRRTRHLRAARIGHHAEGAELVAAFLHGHERGDAARADRRAGRRHQMIELVFGRKLGVDHAALAFGARHEFGQPVVALRAEYHVDDGGAANDLLALGLRHAAGHCDQHAAAVARRAFLERAHAAELRIDLLGGLFADMACVEDEQIDVFGAGGFHVSFARQRVGHTMGIVDVHLATVGLDVQLARSAHSGLIDPAGSAGPRSRQPFDIH
jgi:hypothetical protein